MVQNIFTLAKVYSPINVELYFSRKLEAEWLVGCLLWKNKIRVHNSLDIKQEFY
jgi:hypothetical protein